MRDPVVYEQLKIGPVGTGRPVLSTDPGLRALSSALASITGAEGLPPSLSLVASICHGSQFPICLYWGADFRMVYNEAWSPIAGDKHPWALGRPGREVWPEIWNIIGPEFDAVVNRGERIWSEDRLLPMHRHGYTEECYFNYSLSPMHGEDGTIVGIFNAVQETTYRVLNERRMRVLRTLAERTASARSAESACRSGADALGEGRADVPFCLVYLLSEEAAAPAQLIAIAGMEVDHLAAPAQISLDEVAAGSWPLATALRLRQVQLVADLDQRFAQPLPGGCWPEPVRSAFIAPIPAPARMQTPVGFLIVGVSPHRAPDNAYRSFVELASTALGIAIQSGRAYEDERRRAEVLAGLDRAKTAFFSNVSHELRTPLTLMLWPLEDLISRAQPPGAGDLEALAMAHRNGLRLLKLVNALLDFSRIEAERAAPQYERVDLAQVTCELAGAFRPACERAGLALEIDCQASLDTVLIDRGMWETIVLNLLSNAFKFTLQGGISVRLRSDTQQMVLAVEDTGAGIPAGELSHIFERFRRVEGAVGRSHEGTGIGLALVRDLVSVLQGEVSVTSTEGRGSRFEVRLPLAGPADLIEASALPRPGAPPQERALAFVQEALSWLPEPSNDLDAPRESESVYPDTTLEPRSQRGRVLVVDDNPDMRNSLRRILEPHYDVTTAQDGLAALAALNSGKPLPDLVLTDVMMPGVDGVELLRRMRAASATQSVPVIVLSARAGEEARLAGLAANADDYVVKPFGSRELLARIRANIEMARVRRESAEAQGMAERHDLLHRLVNAQEGERLHIARELHDQMGQDATGLLLGLKSLEAWVGESEGKERLIWLQALADKIGQNLHHTAWKLRPTSLDDLGLLNALETYVSDWGSRFGIQVDLHVSGPKRDRFAPEVETVVYRAVQEALTNVLKHADASLVSLVLEATEERLQVILEDNGKGFDPDTVAKNGRLGLAGMRERLALVDGTLSIDAGPGMGCTLFLRIPLRPAGSDAGAAL